MSGETTVAANFDHSTHVGTITFVRGRDNYFDVALLESIAEAAEQVAGDGARAVVLRSGARHFCAGAEVTRGPAEQGRHLYDVVPRLFRLPVPLVAAVGGAAIGGGLGLALACDFRVAAPGAVFAANFARLGFSQGFALTRTLPSVVGPQRAAEMLYTGRRLDAGEALAIGLCDRLADPAGLDRAAAGFAAAIAGSAPLAVATIRASLRRDLAAAVEQTLAGERADQERLMTTEDFREGVRALRDRRDPEFAGQ